MFAARFFAPRYYAPRYFPEVGFTPATVPAVRIIRISGRRDNILSILGRRDNIISIPGSV